MENSSIRRQWLDSYQSHLLEEEHSPQTIRKYIHDIAFFFSFLPAEAEISKEKVLAYKQELIQKYRPASANSMLVALNGFLSYIGLAQCRVRLFKLQRRSFRSPEKDLTRQEYERLVKAAKSHRNERLSLLLQTICSTGIRVSEHRFVTVEALQTGQVQISNKGKMRVIILPRELRGLLLQFCKKKRLTTGPVFVTRTGKPMNRTNIWCMMKRLCAQAHVDSQKSVSAQSQTPVCAHFLPNGKGYRPPGGYSGTFKYRNNEDIYTYKQYRARKSDLPPPFVDLKHNAHYVT